jgi:hypothetical protein
MTPPSNPSSPQSSSERVVLVRRLAGVLVVALYVATWSDGKPFREDSVENFRQALRLEVVSKSPGYREKLSADPARLKVALDFRRANLEKTARALKTPAEVGQALLLLDWPTLPRLTEKGTRIDPLSEFDRRALTVFEQKAQDIDLKVRQELIKRFVDE